MLTVLQKICLFLKSNFKMNYKNKNDKFPEISEFSILKAFLF